jgi:hypothetical protein
MEPNSGSRKDYYAQKGGAGVLSILKQKQRAPHYLLTSPRNKANVIKSLGVSQHDHTFY